MTTYTGEPLRQELIRGAELALVATLGLIEEARGKRTAYLVALKACNAAVQAASEALTVTKQAEQSAQLALDQLDNEIPQFERDISNLQSLIAAYKAGAKLPYQSLTDVGQ